MDETRSSKNNRLIWWLASHPKSGNTWLRMFLSAYRNGGKVDINAIHDCNIDDIQPYYHHVVSPKPLTSLGNEEQIFLRPAALLHLLSNHRREGGPLFVKTHYANCKILDIPSIPYALSAGAICIVRDPRDVAVSFSRHRGESLDDTIKSMARSDHLLRRPPLYQLLGSWNDHVKSWLHAKNLNVLMVRYEDLLTEPKTAFVGMLRFLRHEIDEDLVDMSIEATKFKNLQRQEKRNGFREKRDGDLFFTNGTAGGWMDTLTEEQAHQIEIDNEEMMREFRYL